MTTSTYSTEAPESQAQGQEWSVPSTTPSSAFRDKGATATRGDQADEHEHVTGLRSFYHPHTQLGECPLYRAEDKTLHFIDVLGQRIHILDLSSGDPKSYSMRTIECPERITFIAFSALRSPEGTSTQRYYVVCYFQGLATVDEADGSWTVLRKIIPDEEKHLVRLNDGAIDSRGRLWFGTIDMPGA
jgi:sugar lactone lactonase YvrE